jgi:hypothetical protein
MIYQIIKKINSRKDAKTQRRKDSAFCRQTSLQKEDLLICWFFPRISALAFFSADSRGKGLQIFNLIWWPIEIFAPEEHYVTRKYKLSRPRIGLHK